MANENAIQEKVLNGEDEFDFDALERLLESELEAEISDLDMLSEQQIKFGDPSSLGETVLNTVWEQFTNQIAIQAGEDFVKANNGLKLDLRDEAHILTAENFEKGNLPNHNQDNIDKYQKRYDETRADYQTDPNMKPQMSKNMRYNDDTKTYERYDREKKEWVGKSKYNEETKTWEEFNPRNGKWEKKLAPGARDKFDTRTADEKGSKTVNKDHVISVAEQLRDNEAAAYMDRDERQEFAKSDVNIQDLDSAANQSKSDLSTEEWLGETRKDGSTQAEHFDIDEEELRRKDKEAREAYEKEKEKAKQRALEEGHKSQKAEALRIGKKAARAVIMNLIADLAKKIVKKLIAWLGLKDKNIKGLLNSIKDAIVDFITDLKSKVVSVTDTAVTVIATSILGPIVGTIKRAWMFIKQGWKSLKEAVDYIKNPENRDKSTTILMMEVGKIVMAGATGAGAILLGEVIEKGLTTIPVLAIEIPLFGSLANIIGIFMGAVVAGIIGALALNLLNSMIEKKQKALLEADMVKKQNEIIKTHETIIVNEMNRTESIKNAVSTNVSSRHKEAGKIIKGSVEKIKSNSEANYEDIDNSEDFMEIDHRIKRLNEEGADEE